MPEVEGVVQRAVRQLCAASPAYPDHEIRRLLGIAPRCVVVSQANHLGVSQRTTVARPSRPLRRCQLDQTFVEQTEGQFPSSCHLRIDRHRRMTAIERPYDLPKPRIVLEVERIKQRDPQFTE